MSFTELKTNVNEDNPGQRWSRSAVTSYERTAGHAEATLLGGWSAGRWPCAALQHFTVMPYLIYTQWWYIQPINHSPNTTWPDTIQSAIVLAQVSSLSVDFPHVVNTPSCCVMAEWADRLVGCMWRRKRSTRTTISCIFLCCFTALFSRQALFFLFKGEKEACS